jgi:hypothetical protein
MRGKGSSFLDSDISRMVGLLYSTDLPMTQIAKRMGCSIGAVNAVNRKKNVRQYDGRRASWTCAVLEPVGRRPASA